MIFLIVLLIFFIPQTNNAYAQSTKLDPDIAWKDHRNIANIISYIGPIVSVSWGLIDAKREHQLKKELIKDGILLGVSEGTKAIIHRNRPDDSDNKSFFSEHTVFAASLFGRNKSASIAITFNTGYLRTAASKHYLTDVIVGGLVGSIISEKMK